MSSLENKIRALMEAKAKLTEAEKEPKSVNKTRFSDNMDDEIDNDNDDNTNKLPKNNDDGDSRQDKDDVTDIDSEDETNGTKKRTAVKEATQPNQSQAAEDQDENRVATDNAQIKRKLANGDKTVIQSKTKVANESKIDLGALFDGVDLTEEFKEKATTVFEAAVAARVTEIRESLEEELAQRAINESEELKEGLVDKIDGYLDFMVEQWIKDNEIALERGIKAEIFESFIGKMKDVFVEHNINLPDEEFDLVESLQEQKEALETSLDEQVAQNIELNKTIKGYAKQKAIEEASKDMTDIDAEKFALLAEEIAFDDADSFAKKLQHISENYVATRKVGQKQLTEDVTRGASDPVDQVNESTKVAPNMASYLKAFKV